jgi:acyl carrier protein
MAKTAIKVSREYLKRKLNSNEVMLYSFEDIIKTHQEDIKVNSVILNRIKELISKNLGIELDTINDESDFFFDLGGTSLDYFSLIASINDEYNVSIPFENDSMHKPIDIAKVLEETLRK